MSDWLEEAAQAVPDRPALRGNERTWTYAQLARDAGRMAGTLQRRHGISAGDRVATLLTTTPDHAVLIHAIRLLGATFTPLNIRLTPPELGALVRKSSPVLVVTEASLRDRLNATPPHPPVCDVADLVRDSLRQDDARPAEAHAAEASAGHGAGDLIAIMSTSGSSEIPKLVPLTRSNFEAAVLASNAIMGVHDDDVWLCVIPLFHVGGLSVLTRSVVNRTAMSIMNGFDERSILHALRAERVTIVSLVPTQLARLLDADPAFCAGDLPHLRTILLGGGPADDRLLSRAEERDLPISPTYGLTETCSQIATMAVSEASAHRGSAGRALPGSRIEIHDDTGAVVPACTTGTIWVSGPMLSAGYIAAEPADAARFHDGWLDTGDLGWLDVDGFLRVEARREDLIVTGGENVVPADVENVLLAHPSVLDAAVFGIADQEWGQIVAAAVVLAGSDASLEDVEAFCREHLAGYKIPKRWSVMDALPRTETGKLVRKEVRRRAGGSGSVG